ncbi:putative F-box/FBD/LRR-repeat protein at4g13965 [Phtheirospermum japonicum]|uniref:Putative F-box/FBD/LRR-repeat protein at4g13965 n=1 Tax=Phtheirospermum japonicum TaxID=374723 RepID=A0A830CQ12_9LAMI|nr:putative F-box/FBD/LRR-repeat protein at4g13965 [Phtheirospermum japonicum]
MASVDRLSALPDQVLCHVLSFLPTKTSVSTSILSTRWKSIWAHVPTLDFNLDDYLTGTAGLPNIISRVLSLHKVQTLDSLRLIFPDCSDFELETLIIIAISRNVKNLHIELDSELTLPRRLFAITTLVRLTLSGCPCFYKTGSDVHLPCLKRLHLDYIQCQDDEDLPRLLSGCPVLEDLILDSVSFAEKKLGCFNVSSSSLKRLTVTLVDNFYDAEDDDLDCRVEINAPALRYLKVCCGSSSISVSPMTSLIEADIDMSCRLTDDHYISMVKFLNCICHVKCLSLRGEYDEKVGIGSFYHPVLYINFLVLINLIMTPGFF